MKKLSFSILVFILISVSQFAPLLRSLFIMPVHSSLERNKSLLKKESISLHIPGGLTTPESDWYPFVLTYCPGTDFAWYTGIDADVTILYNFPAFDSKLGTSALYDPASPCYNSFYGAYLVQMDDQIFGFNKDTSLNIEETVLVPQFDFEYLVMRSFGADRDDIIFEWDVETMESDISYAGHDGWTKITASMYVSGAAHTRDGFKQTYLQYGPPLKHSSEDFSPIAMYGIIYGHYFEEWDTSIFFYVITPSKDLAEKTDLEILSKSTLHLKPVRM